MIKRTKLRELVELQRGQSYKGALLGEPGPVLLGLGTINRNGGFRAEKLKTYGGQSSPKILLGPGDLYVSLKDVTHAADLLGAVARVPESIETGRLTQDTVRLEIKSRSVNNHYLYWALQTPEYRSYCRLRGTGTTNLDLSRNDFLEFTIRLPGTHEQQAIAEVLGALDDKIAANTKLARLSLEISSAIFQSHVRGLARSASTFSDLAKISGGGTPSTKVPEFWAGDINWATPSDVTALAGPYLRSTSRRISDEGLQACSSSLFQPGAILMTSRATIGAFAIAQTATAVNQGFIVVEPMHEYMHYWLFHEMHSRVDEFLSLANGATFLELSRGNFKKLPIRLAEPEVLNSFAEIAGSLHSSAAAAHRENETLAATRDALLPQLMSGKLRVRDAETAVESVV